MPRNEMDLSDLVMKNLEEHSRQQRTLVKNEGKLINFQAN